MPTYEDYHSVRYDIAGCVINDSTPEEQWACPKCDMFIDIETN